ncbi:hypothetical protein TIFTF001_010597 [Ficus carica]|uniref:Glycosyltransferase n=1 Tax=Ficus carica TaxID=3494 RepID=A0AA88DHQ4_FICCA|nr:hypothetical protein TIFTF001_010597 [Ficus carica]
MSGTTPRVLIFPLSAQGHVNSMLKLAELLALAGLHVTFLNTEYIHDRLIRYTNMLSRFSRYPGFLFRTIADGLPEDHPRSGDRFMEVVDSMNETTKPLFKEMLVSGELGSEISPKVTCIIADGIFGKFTNDVSEELGIPIILFRTISSCAVWSYFFLTKLIEIGELPIKGKEDMDRQITGVPGMESFLRCRDLPGFCRVTDTSDPYLHLVSRETHQCPRAQALILNTFEDLEGPILSHIRTKCPNIYTIGPLHAHLNLRLSKKINPSLSRSPNSLFDVDRGCMAWLDAQPPSSVIYVSFGSITTMSNDDLMEFWYGLVNCNKRFLWVIRPDLVAEKGGGDGRIPVELTAATTERGYIVGWVPQEEVLAHKAVGGFLTHCGWNSTLESVVAGVPMICWPYFADQQINSRYVGEVWKLGIDMKDVCNRKVVEKMVNDLMVERREEFVKSTAEMARLARESVSESGSSYCNLNRLVEDIRLVTSTQLNFH